jgi:unsaturated rhamnogalacturonyl hydrolase
MKLRWVCGLAGWAAALALFSATAGTVPAHEQAAHSRGVTALTAGSRVADWQLAHMDNFDYVGLEAHRDDTKSPRDWVQAAFYIGLAQFADAAADPHYTDAVLTHGTAEGWGFDSRPRHADADATGSVWVWAAERTHDPAKLIPTRARFDAVLADPSTVSLEFEAAPPGRAPHCQDRWCWSDALFMAPPSWVALAKATGEERYLAHADSEFWATTDYLYDRSEHLYYRDSRFIPQRDAKGRKIFWGRGNGWVLADLITRAAAHTRDQRHGLFRLWPRVGPQSRVVATKALSAFRRSWLARANGRSATGRQARLGAAHRRRT